MTEGNNRTNGNSSIGDRQDNQENGITAELMQNTFTAEEATNTMGVGTFQVKLIVLSGFVWMARGFEIVLQRSISPLLTCNWMLRRWHGALFVTITLLFTVLGCFLYGIWSDNYGRRTALSSSLIFLFVFGAVSAGLPSYTWFVIFRAVAGFAVGGLSQTLVLCCEYVPRRQRGRSVYILSCFWALGVVVMLWLLYTTMDTKGAWRIYVAIGALPAFLAMVMMRFFPESFRFLMVSNQYIAANEIVAEMAESNNKELEGNLQMLPKQKNRGRVSDLLGYPYTSSTLLLWLMGLMTSISFMGLNLITPLLTLKETNIFVPASVPSLDFLGNVSADIPCLKGMSTNEFVFTVWTSALDFPGFVIYMILVDIVGRKVLLCASYLLSTLFIGLLFIPSTKIVMFAGFIYAARTLLVSQFDLLLLTTAESFPTSHRGTAVGLVAASFYMGHFLYSYIIQGLLRLGLMYAIILCAVLAFVCAAASVCLKHETRKREMEDIIKK